MKIIRDGKEIELTQKEMQDAFYEVQDNYDREDIEEYFDQLSDEDIMDAWGITREELNKQIPAIAHRYRKYRNDEDDWMMCRDYAISYILD